MALEMTGSNWSTKLFYIVIAYYDFGLVTFYNLKQQFMVSEVNKRRTF